MSLILCCKKKKQMAAHQGSTIVLLLGKRLATLLNCGALVCGNFFFFFLFGHMVMASTMTMCKIFGVHLLKLSFSFYCIIQVEVSSHGHSTFF